MRATLVKPKLVTIPASGVLELFDSSGQNSHPERFILTVLNKAGGSLTDLQCQVRDVGDSIDDGINTAVNIANPTPAIDPSTGFDTNEVAQPPIFITPGAWQVYIAGASWIDTANGAQRDWTCTTPPNTLAVGQESLATVKTLGIRYMRFIAMGAPGTVLQVALSGSYIGGPAH